jgi:hypothetical protein
MAVWRHLSCGAVCWTCLSTASSQELCLSPLATSQACSRTRTRHHTALLRLHRHGGRGVCDRVLYLSDNGFSGSIPSTFSRLQALTSVRHLVYADRRMPRVAAVAERLSSATFVCADASCVVGQLRRHLRLCLLWTPDAIRVDDEFIVSVVHSRKPVLAGSVLQYLRRVNGDLV